jgi:hypothetical protein
MRTRKGYGIMYDKYSGNALANAQAKAPTLGMGPSKLKILCVKCQKDKPLLGHTKRNGLSFCKECSDENK